MLIAAIIILILCAGGLIFCLTKIKDDKNKKLYIISSSVLGAVSFLLLIFIILNGVFLSNRRNQPPDNTSEESSSLEESSTAEVSSQVLESTNPVSQTFEELISTRVNHETSTKKQIESTKPQHSALKPKNHPDPLGFTKKSYPKHPILKNQNEIAVYMLNQFISGNFDLTFYIPRNELYGAFVLENASEAARSYYLFGSYKGYNSNTEDHGDKEGVTARYTINRYNVETDIETFNFALDYVKKHPVPKGGFTYASEKKYMREIHDYIIRRVTYDPMGFNPHNLFQYDIYDAKQEAYNALIEKSAVCAGYAKAVALIAQAAGIDCVWAWGNDNGDSSHAWNVVYPCDGSEPVVVDATWDDHENFENPDETLDDYFYIPVSKDSHHRIDSDMESFLNYIHK